MIGCAPQNYPQLSLPADKVGFLDSLVPSIYWVAQDIGLGSLGYCYSESQQVPFAAVTRYGIASVSALKFSLTIAMTALGDSCLQTEKMVTS